MKTINNSLMLESIIKKSLFEQGSLVFDKGKGKQAKKQNHELDVDTSPGGIQKTTAALWILSAIGVFGAGILVKMGLMRGIPSLHKFLLKYFGGKIGNFGNWIASKSGRRQIIKRTEYLYGKGKIDKATRDKIIDAMDDPRTIAMLREEMVKIAKKEFVKGDISAAEFLSTLEASVAKKYKAEIEALERQGLAGNRNAPKTTTPKKPKPVTPGTIVFKDIKPVTEKVFNNTINKHIDEIRKDYSIIEMIAYKDGHGPLYVRVQRLKQELTNAAKPVKRFKQHVDNFEEYVKLCKENGIVLSDNIMDQKRVWLYYKLKQLFK
jgi:hypothetical protein